MLIRRMRNGDTLTLGEVTIEVRKSTEKNLVLAIDAPTAVTVHHVRDGEKVSSDEQPVT
jgi:sRNA-binding carbon storage regulator CsrA